MMSMLHFVVVVVVVVVVATECLTIFIGFAIDRSKKYIKTIKNHMKIDAVDPWSAAETPHTPPSHNG